MYTFKRNASRLLVPKISFLSITLFTIYFILRSQIHWIQLSGRQENVANTILLVTLLVVYTIFIVKWYQLRRHRLHFFPEHLMFGSQKIPYTNIAKVSTKRGMLDKLFQTYTLTVNKTKIKGLIREHLDSYLHTLIESIETRKTDSFDSD